MAALFHSIDELKVYVSGAVDSDEDFLEGIASDIDNAALRHLTPWLGDGLYSHIVALYPDADVDSKESVLTEKIQRVLAPLALYHASKTKNIRFGSQGLSRNENVPFRYQEDDYREEMLIAGYEHLELLLKYLEENKLDFSVSPLVWEGEERHLGRILRYASDFRRASAFRISRYTFEFMLPIIEEVEYHAIECNLPSQFLTKLKTNLENENEKHALFLVKNIIAHFTVVEALRRQLVVMQDGQLVQIESYGDQSSKRKTTAPLSMTEKVHSWEEVSAHRTWIRLKKHLDNKANYPLLYHTSVGGTNADTDAWGYEAPITEQDIDIAVEMLESWKNKKVVGL
jgi:hypothetical protein